MGVNGSFQVLEKNVQRAIPPLDRQQVRPDFIFLDPPYQLRDEYQKTFEALGNSALTEKALVIAEHEKKNDVAEKFGDLQRIRKLEQGDAALSFYRRN